MLFKKKHTNPNDKELIRRCVQNDRQAQEILYKKYFRYVFFICQKRISEESEVLTVLNNVFLKVFKNVQHLKNTDALKGWIATITWRELSSYYKTNNNYTFTEIDDAIFGSDSNKALELLNMEVLNEEINALVGMPKKVFIMHVIEGYKHSEIADTLNLTVSNSKWHLAEAKRILRDRLAKKQLDGKS